jgi:tripartite-type tricarboxylate transporter receptor subunit TctC
MKRILTALLFSLASAVSVAGSEIEFTVHHAPGGPSDRATRLLAQELTGNRYVVVNRPGASGKIAMRQLMSKPSMMIATMPQIFVTNPLMFADLEYDPTQDLELVAVIGVMPNVLACNNKHGFKTFVDFKNSTKSLNFGVAGYGSSEHIATAVMLNQWPNTHQIIPYSQGGSTSLNDLLGGNIDCMFANYPLIKGHVTDSTRITVLMTSHELGLKTQTWAQVFGSGYPVHSQLGLIINQRLDSQIKSQIKADVAQAIKKLGFDQEIRDMGLFPILKTDSASIKESLAIHQRLKDFILKVNLKLN